MSQHWENQVAADMVPLSAGCPVNLCVKWEYLVAALQSCVMCLESLYQLYKHFVFLCSTVDMKKHFWEI
jgi:hypothetical protein